MCLSKVILIAVVALMFMVTIQVSGEDGSSSEPTSNETEIPSTEAAGTKETDSSEVSESATTLEGENTPTLPAETSTTGGIVTTSTSSPSGSTETDTTTTTTSTTTTSPPAPSQCGKCMENMVSCFNTTSFYWCLDGQSPSKTLNHCPDGSVCSSASEICVKDGIPECEPKCNVCHGNMTLACTSRTEFSICQADGSLSSMRGVCSDNEVCNIDMYKLNSRDICSPSCAYEPTCYIDKDDGPITTTTQGPSTEGQDICVRNIEKLPGYFPNENDLSCETYVYCQNSIDGEPIALIMKCSEGTFFNQSQGKCTDLKTEGCL